MSKGQSIGLFSDLNVNFPANLPMSKTTKSVKSKKSVKQVAKVGEKATAEPARNSVSKSSGFHAVKNSFAKYQLKDKGGYITQEFQDFGYRMAIALDDVPAASKYMRLAKRESRALLERALSFVSDAKDVKNKPALFLWKMKKMKTELKAGIPEAKL